MTKTFEELEAKVDKIDTALRELTHALLGDPEARDLYVKNRANNVTPNIREPPLGLVEMLQNSITTVMARVDAFKNNVDTRLTFANRLEAFFGPLIEGKAPPLDGSQVATKAYVDDAIARFAGVVRIEFLKLHNTALDRIEKLHSETSEARGIAVLIKEIAGQYAIPANTTFMWLWATFAERVAERSRPSRIASLVYALTGKPPTNGASS